MRKLTTLVASTLRDGSKTVFMHMHFGVQSPEQIALLYNFCSSIWRQVLVYPVTLHSLSVDPGGYINCEDHL